MQSLVDKTFVNATRKKVSLSWPGDSILPTLNYSNSTGFRHVSTKKHLAEKWYRITKVNNSFYSSSLYNSEASPVTANTVTLSLILAVLVGIILLFGAIYGINKGYIDIIDYVGNAVKYK